MVDVYRGDIVLTDLNPVIGTEQAGIRPAVIIQTDKANISSPHTIIAPFTSRIRKAILPSHVFIPCEGTCLSKDSVVLCEQMRVIDKKRIIKVIGKLQSNQIDELNSALLIILDL